MIKKIKWIDRKFNFDFPPGLFPCIIERLRGTPARVEELVSKISAEILINRIDGGWSIQEHIGHLLDLDELHYGRLDDYFNGLELLRPADITNKKTHEANHNENLIQNILELFRKERMKFINRIEELNDDQINAVAQHPRLKQPMRLIDMCFFIAEHDDHHLASINEILKSH